MSGSVFVFYCRCDTCHNCGSSKSMHSSSGFCRSRSKSGAAEARLCLGTPRLPSCPRFWGRKCASTLYIQAVSRILSTICVVVGLKSWCPCYCWPSLVLSFQKLPTRLILSPPSSLCEASNTWACPHTVGTASLTSLWPHLP